MFEMSLNLSASTMAINWAFLSVKKKVDEMVTWRELKRALAMEPRWARWRAWDSGERRVVLRKNAVK